ncbi:MAG: hypothetical protein ACYC3Q_15565 [Gemmatimonadaceae bacterium]
MPGPNSGSDENPGCRGSGGTGRGSIGGSETGGAGTGSPTSDNQGWSCSSLVTPLGRISARADRIVVPSDACSAFCSMVTALIWSLSGSNSAK